MRANSIWSALNSKGWDLLEEWKAQAEPESMHLEFKKGAWQGDDARADDRKNLARTMSGFGNTEGGVLIFGVSTTTGKPDRFEDIEPISRVHEYAESLRKFMRDLTTPTIPGADIVALEDPADKTRGVAVAYVPFNDAGPGPYRATGSIAAEVKDRYYIRIANGTDVMSHQHLADRFGHTAPPQLELQVRVERINLDLTSRSPVRFEWRLFNRGRGAARRPAVLLIDPPPMAWEDSDLGLGFAIRESTSDTGEDRVLVEPDSANVLLYPGMDRIIALTETRVDVRQRDFCLSVRRNFTRSMLSRVGAPPSCL